MIIGLRYIPNFITDLQHDFIVKEIDEQPWSNELKRRVQHYGYKYDYTRKMINESMKVESLRNWMKLYGRSFVNKEIFQSAPDQVIVNEYQPGQGIAKHIDCQPCFGETIASLSLLSSCVIEFMSRDKKSKLELVLEPKSLLILEKQARHNWFHGIPARLMDGEVTRGRRVSVTFRTVILS